MDRCRRSTLFAAGGIVVFVGCLEDSRETEDSRGDEQQTTENERNDQEPEKAGEGNREANAEDDSESNGPNDHGDDRTETTERVQREPSDEAVSVHYEVLNLDVQRNPDPSVIRNREPDDQGHYLTIFADENDAERIRPDGHRSEEVLRFLRETDFHEQYLVGLQVQTGTTGCRTITIDNAVVDNGVLYLTGSTASLEDVICVDTPGTITALVRIEEVASGVPQRVIAEIGSLEIS